MSPSKSVSFTLLAASFLALVLGDVCSPHCLAEPWDSACAQCQINSSTVLTGISDGCGMMDWMPSCSVQKICQANPSLAQGQYCAPISIWMEQCLIDMNMGNCDAVISTCKPANSTVQECKSPMLPFPKMTTKVFSNAVLSICINMTMDACSKCPGSTTPGSHLKCDLLGTYSSLCIEMPDMPECSYWKDICKVVPDWPICPGLPNSPDGEKPSMRMWFHFSLAEWVLFKEWVPNSSATFAATWFAVVVMAMLHEFLKLARVKLEKRWQDYVALKQAEATKPLNALSSEDDYAVTTNQSPNFYLLVDVPRAAMQALELAWSLLVMLVAMTYNIALFLAIPFGCFVGQLFVGRYMSYKPASCCA